MTERLTDQQLQILWEQWQPAAIEIQALRARVAKLEAALKPFADAHFYYNDAGKPDDLTTGIGGVTYGDFRQAVSILAGG